MKTFIFIALILFSSPKLFAESDTIWNFHSTYLMPYFNPGFTLDGSRFIWNRSDYFRCISSSDGTVIQDSIVPKGLHNNTILLSSDSLNYMFFDDGILKIYSLDSFKLVRQSDTIYLGDFDISGWSPFVYYPNSKSMCLSNNGRYLFVVFYQIKQNTKEEKYMLYKIDLQNLQIINRKQLDYDIALLTLPTNDNLFIGEGSFQKLFYIEFRSVDSLSIVKKIVYNKNQNNDGLYLNCSPDGKYLAGGTGYNVRIWDLTNDSLIHTLSLGGQKVAGFVCFSRDSKCLVTGYDSLRIWNFKNESISYIYGFAALTGLSISPDNTMICAGRDDDITMLHARWETTGVKSDEDPTPTFIYPNPTSDFIEISVGENGRPPLQRDVRIYNVYGQNVSSTWAGLEPAPTIRIDVSGLAPGMYIVRIGDRVGKFVKL